ncbi:MAG: hypothetical protein PHC80_04895 [Eubacteriales bacterium]|nr:hypothetical protein [Eubacteriales bacterium]
MTKHKKNRLPVDEADVISAGEMTGAVPLPPLDVASYESYEDLMDIAADAEKYKE